MNTYLKWTLWIFGALLLATAFFALGYFAYTHWNADSWMMSMRGQVVWRDGQTPLRDMPMRPDLIRPDRRFGGFPLLGFFLGTVLCLVIPVLILLGVVALLQNLRRSYKVVAVAPAAVPAPPLVPTAEDSKSCSNCGRIVQSDWTHCPYCGNNLA